MSQPTCFLALPSCGQYQMGTVNSLFYPGQKLEVRPVPGVSSLLCQNFSNLLATCLYGGIAFDYFAMLHADVQPKPDWLATLYEEQQATGADVVSVIIPIKNRVGVTSTGVGRKDSRKVRRLTMHEIYDLPATFGLLDLPGEDSRHYLAVNTGCMLWKRGRWWEEFLAAGGFQMEHWSEKDAEGRWAPWCLPEDWHFSRWAADKLHVAATRKVGCDHIGFPTVGNGCAWGEWKTDQDFKGY